MASIGHIAVGMAAARVCRRRQPRRWSLITSMAVWSFLSLLPDADVLGFHFGIPYSAPWGHRGATHSFAFAVLVGAAVGAFAKLLQLPPLRTAILGTAVLASHALLDTLTDGGLGCALFWPFDHARYFAPWNPIPVAPIGRAFFSGEGLRVAAIEALFFAPVLIFAVWPRKR